MSIEDSIKRLREALAAGPTPGPWEFGAYGGDKIHIGQCGHSKHGAIAKMVGRWSIPWDATDESRQAFNDADYIAACSPEVLAHLLAALDEREALRAVPHKQSALEQQADAWHAVCGVLNEVEPTWLDGPANGVDCAVAAIRRLAAARKEPT